MFDWTDNRNKARHSFLRRLMNPSFSGASLRELEVTMNLYFDEFIIGVRERISKNDGVVELNEWFHNLSFDV
jgi:cytochrome P450